MRPPVQFFAILMLMVKTLNFNGLDMQNGEVNAFYLSSGLLFRQGSASDLFAFFGLFFAFYSLAFLEELGGDFFFDVFLELFQGDKVALLELLDLRCDVPKPGGFGRDLLELPEGIVHLAGALICKAEVIVHAKPVLRIARQTFRIVQGVADLHSGFAKISRFHVAEPQHIPALDKLWLT